ncbi:hypothetical protein [Halorussus amylolyticus]|uniref:hypothetical protein n=1 Tax=Halorussus amylolyticus TaxID=1126242 RepID=UPI0010527F44|nr:hypothetical protein [Halorussus amylolyticus]
MSPDEQPSEGPTPILFDTTVLSNYARSRSMEWLVRTISIPVTVPAVERELKRGRKEGYEYLQSALDRASHVETVPDGPANELSVVEPPSTVDVPESVSKLDVGEAHALRGTWPNRILATDDLDARRLARDCDVAVTGSVGILVDGVERDELPMDVADEWLETWREAGYRSPVESVTEILD